MDNLNNNTQEKKRGAGLTIMIILMLLGNSSAASFYLMNPEIVQLSAPEAPIFLGYIIGLISLIGAISSILIWKWKRIGVYGIALITILGVLVNIYLGLPITTILIALIGPAILFYLVKIRWIQFS